MPYMATDLAILNAEQYDVGVRFPNIRLTKKSRPAMGVGNGAGPRKRTKTQPSDGRDEEEKKRSRGRPRLDTTDETAADVSAVVECLPSPSPSDVP